MRKRVRLPEAEGRTAGLQYQHGRQRASGQVPTGLHQVRTEDLRGGARETGPASGLVLPGLVVRELQLLPAEEDQPDTLHAAHPEAPFQPERRSQEAEDPQPHRVVGLRFFR